MSEAMLTETATAELNSRFICAVQESYASYTEHGARSPKKLLPLHQWVADEMQSVLGEEHAMKSLRKDGEGKEEKIEGKYYDKNVDISISKQDSVPLAIISIKFVTSNFQQNANNYFEHLMGETANIRRTNVGVGHLMVLPYKLPYLNNQSDVTKIEIIKNSHLQKYVKLAQDGNHPHRPDATGIVIISLPIDDLENHNEVTLMNLDEMCVTAEVKRALSNDFSIHNFISTMKILVEAKG